MHSFEVSLGYESVDRSTFSMKRDTCCQLLFHCYISDRIETEQRPVLFPCSSIRRDTIPDILQSNGMLRNEMGDNLTFLSPHHLKFMYRYLF
jgi:hypothetical protein